MFYFLRQDLFSASDIIEIVGHTALTAEYPWIRGVRFDRPLPVETLDLDPAYGSQFPEFFDTSVPVMSLRMIQALQSWGATNIDAYPIRLRNIVSNELNIDYAAVNVVGAVDAADLGASEYRMELGAPYFTGRISIDPDRVGGLSMFRLLDGPGFIVVSQDLGQRIRDMSFRAVLLQATTDYQGA